MSFSAPTIKQTSIAGAILAFTATLAFLYTTIVTDWSRLLFDRQPSDQIIDISTLHFHRDLPVTDKVFNDIILGESSDNEILITVPNLSRIDSSKSENFGDQVAKAIKSPMPNMQNKNFAFYFDIDNSILKGIDSPTLFFHRLPSASWKIFVNQELVRTGGPNDLFITAKIEPSEREKTRISFLVENRSPSRIPGIYFTFGLTVRSAAEAGWAQQNLPAQQEYPRVFATLFLSVFCLIGLVMAISTPQYSDIWAYAAFCGSLAMTIWKNTPFFWGAFEWSANGVSLAYDASWLTFDLCFMLTAVVLNLAFFRIRGHWFRVITFGAVASAIYIFYRNYPGWNPDIKSYQAYANVGRAVVVLLIFSQAVGSLIGFADLFKAWKQAKSTGIKPRALKIKRRIAYALVFTFGIGIMQYFYLSGLVKQSTTPGPDLFLLAGIVPAGLILLLFSWTIGAANRERLKLAPSLEVVDELLLEYGDRAIYETDKRGSVVRNEFGHAVKKEYIGALAWFDLKGFTMTDGLRKIDERHRSEVDQFFADVDMDLSDLYHNLFPRFRFKWAGDELSWAYFAKSKEEADQMVERSFVIWQKNAARLTAKWKTNLIERLGPHMDQAVIQAMEYVDVHVAFTRLDDLKIKPGLFESKADYDSPSYTRISRAFKKSSHLKVAVFEDAGLKITANDKTHAVRWVPALSLEREQELRAELERNPSAIKRINEELLLAKTGFLEFDSEDQPTKVDGAAA